MWAFPVPGDAFGKEPAKAGYRGSESRERTVDAAALESQRKAMERLRALLSKNRGKPEEPMILERLGEAQQEAAGMEFRIVHGPANKGKGAADLTAYRGYMRGSIATLTELITRFPGSTELPRARAMLGKAYEEIGKKAEAEKEYRILVTQHPKAPEVGGAYLALADMAIAANDPGKAVRYLTELEKRESDPRYPFALHRLAWAYYNLKQPSKGVAYLEKTVESRNESLKELALLDVPLFYLEGREQKLPQYRSEQAPHYFKSLDQGPLLGKMILRYAKLLRSHGHAEDLIAYKNVLLESQSNRAETFEVVTIVFEDQLNHRRFEKLSATADEIAAFQRREKSPEALQKAQKLLLDSAAEIQKLIARNKDATDVGKLNQGLADVYGAFTKLVDSNDPRIAKVRYNLAESLFTTRQFDAATEHYRWVAEHSSASREEAQQKAIASRYESLRARNLIPKDLKARSLESSSGGKLDDAASEWIAWVDARQGSRKGDSNDSFYFEATRMIYAGGDIDRAVSRLNDFAMKNPGSKLALPSAALVLDSYVAGSDWNALHPVVTRFLEVKEWKGTPLHERLRKLDSEVAYKKLEKSYSSGDYASSLKQAEDYLRSHGASKNAGDALALAGNSAMALKDRTQAMRYLSRLISEAPKSEAAQAALLSRGSLLESSFDFEGAARDYQSWLDAQSKPKAGLQARVLTLWWVSGNQARLSQALRDPKICTGDQADTCERFRALSYLAGSDRTKEMTLRAFYRARRGAESNRPIWAALALEGSRHLAFRDRNVTIHHLMAQWKALDPLFQAYLIPSLSKSVPETFRLNRRGIQEVAPLVLTEKYLAYRMEILREFENIAVKAAQLPMARIRSAALNEVASAYLDVSEGLNQVSAKKGIQLDAAKLVMPFEEKGQALRKNAFEIASNAAIEEEQLEAIVGPFMKANPSQAKQMSQERVRKPRSLDLFALELLDPENQSRSPSKDCRETDQCLIGHFGSAARERLWARVAFLVHEAREKKLVSAAQLGLMRSIAFSAMGAQAEGLKELATISSDLPGEAQRRSSLYLLAQYYRSLSREKTREMLDRVRSMSSEEPEVASARKWIGG